MFIVVNVKTAHTLPTPGNLLTIGAVPVYSDGTISNDRFYQRLAYVQDTVDPGTMEWWEKQNEEAKEEAFSWSLSRNHPLSVAKMFHNWVTEFKTETEDCFFTANPASFDWPWIKLLFDFYQVENPFSHRTLCLRSMRFGIEGGEFGKSREGFEPTIPHHALHDAYAEAVDLQELIRG